MKILVTGGAGFIGSNFVHHVLGETEHTICVLDKLTYAGTLANLPTVNETPRLEFIEGDIADRAAVRGAFEAFDPDWVANFAAESHVDRSIDSPGDFVRTNISGTFELLEAFRALSGEGRRFLHVSTDEVFGSLGPTGLFREDTPYSPRSPYSASKASADHLARAYFHTYGSRVIVSNCSNNYGPRQFPEKLIPLMILNALEGRPLPIYGDGSNVRDWLHVDDHCRGLLRILERGVPGESYNLGGEAERTNLQVVDAICAQLERIVPASTNSKLAAAGASSYTDLKQYVTDRPGHDQRYAIDATKIRAELEWEPARSFEEGLASTIEWYLGNRDWCETVSGVYDRDRLGLHK